MNRISFIRSMLTWFLTSAIFVSVFVLSEESSGENKCCDYFPPLCDNFDNYYINDERETFMWCPPDNIDETSITHFVEKAKNLGYTEDASLSILRQNDYDAPKSYSTLTQQIVSNRLLLLNHAQTITSFVNTITGKRRLGRSTARCFNKVRSKFPDYTIGEIIDFYMRNKLTIKRRIARCKRQVKKLSSIPSEEEFMKILETIQRLPDKAVEVKLADEKVIDLTEEINEYEDEQEDNEEDDCVIMDQYNQVCPEWSADDVNIFHIAIREFGVNFNLLSSVVGTKNVEMVRSFYETINLT